MNRREIASLIILVAVIAFGAYSYFNRSFSDTRNRFLLDTFVEISASSQSKNVGKSIDSVFVYIEKMETLLDEYDPISWISLFNNGPAGYYPIDSDIYELLCISDSLYQLTNGSFDVTIKPVFDLWNFGGAEALADTVVLIPPDSMEIKEKLKLVGFDQIRYNDKRIYKPEGYQISFGAIAKGFILDKARLMMQDMGLKKAYITCRSSMTIFGSDLPRVIMIAHPRDPNQEIASFKLSNSSLATSGDYQQFFEYDGRYYHHILNAHTGYPVQGIYSVTVIHPSAAWADGLSTALFTIDPIKAVEIVKNYPGANIVIYHDQQDSIVSLKSKGMQQLSFHEKL